MLSGHLLFDRIVLWFQWNENACSNSIIHNIFICELSIRIFIFLTVTTASLMTTFLQWIGVAQLCYSARMPILRSGNTATQHFYITCYPVIFNVIYFPVVCDVALQCDNMFYSTRNVILVQAYLIRQWVECNNPNQPIYNYFQMFWLH